MFFFSVIHMCQFMAYLLQEAKSSKWFLVTHLKITVPESVLIPNSTLLVDLLNLGIKELD